MLQNWPLDGAKHPVGLIIIREHDAIIGIMASIHTYCYSCPGVNASVMQGYMMHACMPNQSGTGKSNLHQQLGKHIVTEVALTASR